MLFGILKGGKVQLNSIARQLQEGLSLKQTTKRLGAHLDVMGLWRRISDSTLRSQGFYLRRCRYMVIDLSDIQKRYAQKMSGLGRVYDGSERKNGWGYWLCNVTGVDECGHLIVPAYSELYSLVEESSSENRKILDAISSVRGVVGDDKIWVMDRGGDRRSIMDYLLQENQQFIIRQVGNRDLIYKGQRLSLKAISRLVKRSYTYTVTKRKKNKPVKETYDCGAVPVQLPGRGETLWLVVLKERRKGYCWLLCHFNCSTKAAAIAIAFEGYGHRWKIEEVHRQVKSDYELEGICLQRYEALKTMNALLWAAVSFLYTRLDSLSHQIISHPELALVNRKGLKELFRFIFYKSAFAVRKLLALSRFYNMNTCSATLKNQLCLALE